MKNFNMKRYLLFISLILNAYAQVSLDSAETLDSIGKINCANAKRTVYFITQEGEQEIVLPIVIRDKKQFKQLKALHNKFVKIKGDLKWYKETIIEQQKYSLKIKINSIDEFRLRDLTTSMNYRPPLVTDINYYLINFHKKQSSSARGIAVNDKVTNTVIAGAGAALAFVIGPAALIPIGLFTFKALFLDD